MDGKGLRNFIEAQLDQACFLFKISNHHYLSDNRDKNTRNKLCALNFLCGVFVAVLRATNFAHCNLCAGFLLRTQMDSEIAGGNLTEPSSCNCYFSSI